MTQDAGSLENLRDIVMPEPVSWWPLAPGWWILFAVFSIWLAWSVVRLAGRWYANAYRRAALRELKSVTSATAIADILKRTALCAWPRHDVAALEGAKWCEWLSSTGHVRVPDSISRVLTTDMFQDRSTPESIRELAAFADVWIRRHRNSGEA